MFFTGGKLSETLSSTPSTETTKTASATENSILPVVVVPAIAPKTPGTQASASATSADNVASATSADNVASANALKVCEKSLNYELTGPNVTSVIYVPFDVANGDCVGNDMVTTSRITSFTKKNDNESTDVFNKRCGEVCDNTPGCAGFSSDDKICHKKKSDCSVNQAPFTRNKTNGFNFYYKSTNKTITDATKTCYLEHKSNNIYCTFGKNTQPTLVGTQVRDFALGYKNQVCAVSNNPKTNNQIFCNDDVTKDTPLTNWYISGTTDGPIWYDVKSHGICVRNSDDKTFCNSHISKKTPDNNYTRIVNK